MRIEELDEGNLPGATALALKLWPGCDYEEEYQHGMRIIKDPVQTTFVARNGAHFAGFIQLALRSDYVEGTATSPVLYLEGLYVEPAYRKLGVARMLVRSAEAWGLQRGCVEMASDAELHNKTSIDFHVSAGFREVNRVVCFVKSLDQ